MEQVKNELIHELVDAFKNFKGAKPTFVKEIGLKSSEFMLIIKLDKFLETYNEKSAKTTELSKILDLSPSTITPLINSLEEKGYIQREYDKVDRRIVWLSFTPKGNELKEEMNKEFNEQMSNLIEKLGLEDARELVRLLKKCTECMQGGTKC